MRVVAGFFKGPVGFAVMGVAVFAAFWWMHLAQLYVIEDIQGEAADGPLVVGHLEQARSRGMTVDEFLRDAPVCRKLREQNPQQSSGYAGNHFYFELYAFVWPLINVLYYPFVKLVGVAGRTVTLYSTFFSAVSWIGAGLLGWRMFGRHAGLLAMAMLACSLSWLIHTKVGYAAWMPSVMLMSAMVFCLHGHLRRPHRGWLVGIGVILGLTYLMGWIVVFFAGLLVMVTFATEGLRTVPRTAGDLAVVAVSALAFVVAFTSAYAEHYQCRAWDVHRAIFDVVRDRAAGGEPVMHRLSIGEKVAYGFKCMFVDMRTSDSHVDKYLEGAPAIPPLFALFFVLGMVYAIKERTLSDRLLLIWTFSVFGIIGSKFIFGHRYALLGMTAMSILAARGILALGQDLARWRGETARWMFYGMAVIGLFVTLQVTHRDFYEGYVRHKPPNFEMDRLRGHYQLSKWIRERGPPAETLVVLGDNIMFSYPSFLLNTYNEDYDYVFWPSLFGSRSTPEQVREWEKEKFTRYRRIVFAFSTQLLGDPSKDVYMNDWRPFIAAHPDAKPGFVFSYNGRPPSLIGFEVRMEPAPPTRVVPRRK